jgi:hypothetical protein
MSSRRAKKILTQIGDDFVKNFTSVFQNAFVLRSSDPGVCWKGGGCVNYATVQEYTGPHTAAIPAPLIVRVQVNIYPPPGLTDYMLKSRAFRDKLGVGSRPLLAKEMTLELYCLPAEVAVFGDWLPRWIDGQFCQVRMPPEPPIPLFWWTWDDLGASLYLPFMNLAGKWWPARQLWTARAKAEYDPWALQLP